MMAGSARCSAAAIAGVTAVVAAQFPRYRATISSA